MAEYFLEPNGQIHADLAFRLGKIIEQYDSINKSDLFNFDSSLCLCILQNLLTIYDEKNKSGGYPLTRDNTFYNKNCKIQEANYFEISTSNIESDNSCSIITIGDFLKALRNSMSHPTAINSGSDFLSTGYFSSSINKKINSYTFVNSPDIKDNSPKFFKNEISLNHYIKNINYNFNFKQINGKYQISNPRITKIKLNVIELKKLTLKLAKLLSQPVQKNWDGLKFNENILKIDYAA